MAFIGLFILLILFIIYCISLFVLIVSTVLFIVGCFMKKKSKAFQVIRIICLPIMCLSSIPTIILLIIIIVNLVLAAKVPNDYVDLPKIARNEIGINVDDQEYSYIDYTLLDYHKEGTPVFSYKPDGLFRKNEWRNVFAFELKSGFTIYRLELNDANISYYIEKSSLDSFNDYYYEHSNWGFEAPNLQEDSLSSKVGDIFDKYLLLMDEATLLENAETITSSTRYSTDSELRLNTFSIEHQSDKIYLCTEVRYNLDEYCYYHYGFELVGKEKELVYQFFFLII